jgi:OOP family OmpA-OmpF porin
MQRMLGIAVVLVAALVMFTPAAEAGAYVGASFTDTAVDVKDIDFDESDSGFKIFGGWNFLKFLGLEGGYYDMGKPSNSSDELDVSAWALSARGILPLGKHFELFGKAGYMAWEIDGSLDDDDFDLTYGVGAAVIIGSRLSIRAEYEILDVDDADIDLYSLGAAFRF